MMGEGMTQRKQGIKDMECGTGPCHAITLLSPSPVSPALFPECIARERGTGEKESEWRRKQRIKLFYECFKGVSKSHHKGNELKVILIIK